MYYREHGVPHFHALYAEYEASVSIESGDMLAGDLPSRAFGLVREWAERHRAELLADWNRAQRMEVLKTIAPLP